jgi:SAM-dependent methyltransferase
MHNALKDYVIAHKELLTGKCVEVGSLDENGSIRTILPDVIGTDMREGPNVDVVCSAENLAEHFGKEHFDSMVSLDAFEHMENWRGCLQGMWAALKTGGWLVITMAAKHKGRHNYPNDYWRADWEHIFQIWPEAKDMSTFGPSMGWVVRKDCDLPDLTKINLIAVP